MENKEVLITVFGISMGFILIMIPVCIILVYNSYSKAKNYSYKVAKITSNIEDEHFKIVGSKDNTNYLELSNFAYFRFPHLIEYSIKKFKNKEDAEKGLNKVLIELKKAKLVKNIKIY